MSVLLQMHVWPSSLAHRLCLGSFFNVDYERCVITLVPNSSSAEVQTLGECAVLGRFGLRTKTQGYTQKENVNYHCLRLQNFMHWQRGCRHTMFIIF